jgi:hypothetical protein
MSQEPVPVIALEYAQPGEPRFSTWRRIVRVTHWVALLSCAAGLIVIGGITHCRHSGHLGHQGLLDALFEGHVGHSATVAATTEAQHDHAVGGDFLHGDVAAMGRELRIDLLLDGPAHALDQRRRIAPRHALDLRRADLQLATGGLCFVVDGRAVEERHAGRFQPQGEAFAIHRPFVAGQFTALGEFQAHVRARRAGIARGQAHAKARDRLAFEAAAAADSLHRPAAADTVVHRFLGWLDGVAR